MPAVQDNFTDSFDQVQNQTQKINKGYKSQKNGT